MNKSDASFEVKLCLQVKDLRKTFPVGIFEKEREILKGLSFSVRSQKVTGFVGANGSGKTTTLKCALGFIFPSAGTIEFFDGQKIGADVLQKIGFFPERPYLYEFLTAGEYLKLHWELSGGGIGFYDACDFVLNQVNLPDVKNRRMRSFSKGMLQRIGIAQAILRKPQFLILDEPMSGLDPDGRLLMKDILRTLHESGTSIFFSSHLLHDLEELCEDLIMIEKGELLFAGELSELRTRFPNKTLEEIFRQLKLQNAGALS